MWRVIRNGIQKFDLYGQPVAPLNIKGETKVHTTCGGLVGMLFTVLLLWFFGLKLRKMVQRTDPNLY